MLYKMKGVYVNDNKIISQKKGGYVHKNTCFVNLLCVFVHKKYGEQLFKEFI